jgi:hypothetical protein
MKVYVVMLDDYEAGWPEAIFDKGDFAIEFAKRKKTDTHDYEVLEYDLNNIDNGYRIQQIFNTAKT